MTIRSLSSPRFAAIVLCTLAALLVVERPLGGKAEVITETSVRAHMGFLASDALNGRGSGTRDEWIAATYIAIVPERLDAPLPHLHADVGRGQWRFRAGG